MTKHVMSSVILALKNNALSHLQFYPRSTNFLMTTAQLKRLLDAAADCTSLCSALHIRSVPDGTPTPQLPELGADDEITDIRNSLIEIPMSDKDRCHPDVNEMLDRIARQLTENFLRDNR